MFTFVIMFPWQMLFSKGMCIIIWIKDQINTGEYLTPSLQCSQSVIENKLI